MAAPILVDLKKPVVIVKVNADKYTRLTMKHEVKYVSSTTSFLFY
jgi:protein disulfide-isomerase A1